MELEEKLISISKPNFIAFTGDMVDMIYDGNFDTYYQRQWFKFTFSPT